MEDQGDHKALADALDRWSRTAEKLLQAGNTTTQTVKVEGMGSMWNGIAIGVALGGAIVCAAWVGFTLQNVHEIQRNNEAFIQATYQQAPEIRERFDQIKAEQAQGQKNSP